jgi:hypothetical protein
VKTGSDFLVKLIPVNSRGENQKRVIWIENLIKMSPEEVIGSEIGLGLHAKSTTFWSIVARKVLDFTRKLTDKTARNKTF